MTRSRVVKVRVTEAEYSDWTEMALRSSVSLSEAIRRAMQGNLPPESPKPLESLRESLATLQRENIKERLPNIYTIAPVIPEGGWVSRPERRKEPCPHGKPGFAFCPECDQ